MTLEERIKSILGETSFIIAGLQTEIEQLKQEIARLKNLDAEEELTPQKADKQGQKA